MMGDRMDTNPSGATTGHVPADWIGLDPDVLSLEVRLLYEGAQRHTPSGWRTYSVDDHLNHALQHLNQYRAGDPEDEYTPEDAFPWNMDPGEYALLQELVHARTRLGFAIAVLLQGGPKKRIPKRRLPL